MAIGLGDKLSRIDVVLVIVIAGTYFPVSQFKMLVILEKRREVHQIEYILFLPFG